MKPRIVKISLPAAGSSACSSSRSLRSRRTTIDTVATINASGTSHSETSAPVAATSASPIIVGATIARRPARFVITTASTAPTPPHASSLFACTATADSNCAITGQPPAR
jgi:hypothetical protein